VRAASTGQQAQWLRSDDRAAKHTIVERVGHGRRVQAVRQEWVPQAVGCGHEACRASHYPATARPSTCRGPMRERKAAKAARPSWRLAAPRSTKRVWGTGCPALASRAQTSSPSNADAAPRHNAAGSSLAATGPRDSLEEGEAAGLVLVEQVACQQHQVHLQAAITGTGRREPEWAASALNRSASRRSGSAGIGGRVFGRLSWPPIGRKGSILLAGKLPVAPGRSSEFPRMP